MISEIDARLYGVEKLNVVLGISAGELSDNQLDAVSGGMDAIYGCPPNGWVQLYTAFYSGLMKGLLSK